VIVHGDWKSLELPVPRGRTMLSVFRGTRPQRRCGPTIRPTGPHRTPDPPRRQAQARLPLLPEHDREAVPGIPRRPYRPCRRHRGLVFAIDLRRL
jgi:hypothetical protein